MDDDAQHRLREEYFISETAAEKINRTHFTQGGRVIAVEPR